MSRRNRFEDGRGRFEQGRFRRESRRGDKALFGLVIAAVGTVVLLKTLGLFAVSISLLWPVILIAIGLMIGIRGRFHNHAWWILILIGTAHLVPVFDINGVSSTRLVWPAAIIIFGLAIVLRSTRKKNSWREECVDTVTNADSTLNVDVTFGGRKEIVTSKDFRGGVANVTFGGVELNLVQADSTESSMQLDLKVSFGGVELIVPAHWEIQNQINPAFGSVEDRRNFRPVSADQEKKTLVLKGSCSFGSIEIKSY